jgi:hypothetical protein
MRPASAGTTSRPANPSRTERAFLFPPADRTHRLQAIVYLIPASMDHQGQDGGGCIGPVGISQWSEQWCIRLRHAWMHAAEPEGPRLGQQVRGSVNGRAIVPLPLPRPALCDSMAKCHARSMSLLSAQHWDRHGARHPHSWVEFTGFMI